MGAGNAFAGEVQTLNLDAASLAEAEKATAKFQLTPLLCAKVVLACVFGAMALHFLSSGRRQNDVGKLLMAGVFGMLTFLIFAL